MAEPFIGEIKMAAFSFAPRNYEFCDGQIVSVSSNEALFSLLGTKYGGDGVSTFGYPDMRGRIPVHKGQGQSKTWMMGIKSGLEMVKLTQNQIPAHRHTLQASNTDANEMNPIGCVLANANSRPLYSSSTQNQVTMSSNTLENTGSDHSHLNLMPTLAINFILATNGIYPSRN